MNHKANWKEIEEAWVELANCTCTTESTIPCLHCDSDSFKVWHQIKTGKAAFSRVSDYDSSSASTYYPVEVRDNSLVRYFVRLSLPYVLIYSTKEKGWSYWNAHYFKTVKEGVGHWRSLENEPKS